MDLFLTNMLIDGLEWYGLLVDYCDAFIRCLDSHSDGTHSLQSEDPSVSKWYAKFLQICSDEESNSYIRWMAWGWVHSQQIFYFGWTIPLIWLHLPLLAEMVTTKLSIFLTKQLQQLTSWICWERSIAVCAFQLNIQGHVLLLLWNNTMQKH